MPITLIRVVNQQKIRRSILLDKLDDGQANTEGYANLPKQKVYVPYANPNDTSVKGYVDLVPSDRVLLSADHGTIKGLSETVPPVITTFAFSSTLTATPVITSVSNLATNTTIDGTTFFSVTPDKTYVIFRTPVGVTQTVPSSAFTTFTNTQIIVPDAAVTIGTPTEGWSVTVKANSKLSNVKPIGNVAAITTAILDAPTAGALTITGVDFLSTLPLTSSVVFTGTGAATLSRATILAAGGIAAFTDTSIVIPASLIGSVVEGATSAAVTAEGFTSAAVALIVRPVLTTAVLAVGDLTLTGTSFLSNASDSSVVITGTGAVTLTKTQILAVPPGAFTETSVIIDSTLIPGVVVTGSSAKVRADGIDSSTVVITL